VVVDREELVQEPGRAVGREVVEQAVGVLERRVAERRLGFPEDDPRAVGAVRCDVSVEVPAVDQAVVRGRKRRRAAWARAERASGPRDDPLPLGSVRVGGDKLDEAIMNYISRNYGMMIGENTAENIKKQIGTAYPGIEVLEMEVKGRNLAEGIPRTFTVTSNEILEALSEPTNQIVTAVKQALEQTPPELGADIAERGLILTGGGALLRDLDRLLREETGLPVMVAEDPLTCVVRGCGIALEKMDKLGNVFASESYKRQ
jgi:hypothetical protein